MPKWNSNSYPCGCNTSTGGGGGGPGGLGPTGPTGSAGPAGPPGETPILNPINYSQTLGSKVSIPSTGGIVVSTNLTTDGNPVQIIANGDANNTTVAAAWGIIQLYRDGSGIGHALRFETSSINENQAYCIQIIDATPPAGLHTYSLRLKSANDTFDFGETYGPIISAVELANVRGATGYTGYTGVTGYTGYTGYSGYTGYTGYTGVTGYTGYTGYSGYTGYTGYTGVTGYTGYTGVQGATGYTGYTGYTG